MNSISFGARGLAALVLCLHGLHVSAETSAARLLDAGARQSTLPVPLGTVSKDVASWQLSHRPTSLSATTNQPVQLQAWASEGQAMQLNGQQGYLGQLRVALTDTHNPRDQSQLLLPIPVAVTDRSGAVIETAEITQLGRWQNVPVSAPHITDGPFAVRVAVGETQQFDALALPVTHPDLELWLEPASPVGWGIGTGTLNARVGDIDQPAGLALSVQVSGALAADEILLGPDGTGSIPLRSGFSSGQVSATLAGARARPLQIVYRSPWLLFIAALAGGLAGAHLSRWGRRNRQSATMVGGMAAGAATLVFAAVPWSARIAGFPELAVLVLATAAAWLGITAWQWPGWYELRYHPRTMQLIDWINRLHDKLQRSTRPT